MSLWLYRAGAAMTTLALPFLALFNRKIRRGLALRIKTRPLPAFSVPPLWLHASSGEFEYAKPLIRELKRRHPGLPIVVTYFSPTFALSVANFPGVDHAMPLPLDLPGPCTSFLSRLRPRALLVARTDFWPEMLAQARRRKIPIEAFSYMQRPTQWPRLTRFRLQFIDRIWCLSEADQAELQSIGVTAQVAVGGDTRFDQVRYRLDHPKELPREMKPTSPCLVAGSTWPEDERVLLPAVIPLLQNRRLRLILVPHEPTDRHIEQLRAELRLAGISYALYSAHQPWDDKAVLLVDKVGVLAELYAWGDLAFVGGSFRRNVHSVMEPLGAGCRTFIGPKHTNHREAIEFQGVQILGRPAVVAVKDVGELQEALESALGDLPNADFRRALIHEFDQRLGASRKLADHVEATFGVHQ